MAAHLQVWDWVAHDDVDRAARRNRFPEAEFLELETVEQFDIDEPPPHPEATFAELGATAEPLLHFLLPPEGLEPGSDEELGIRWYRIEPDASNMSYFLAATAILGGRVRIPGIDASSAQGDVKFARVLERMGCRVADADGHVELRGGDLTIAWQQGESPVFMTGPAAEVFTGRIRV